MGWFPSCLPRLLVAVLVVALVPSGAAAASTDDLASRLAETQSERERTEMRLEDLAVAESAARDRLAAVDAELDRAERELTDLEHSLSEARETSDRATERASQARQRLGEVRDELTEVETALDGKRDRLEARLRAAFKYGQVSLVEAFTGVRDMTDFLNSTTYVRHVLDGDHELVDEVAGLVASVERRRADAQAVRVEVEHAAAVSRAATAEVEEAAAEQHRLAEVVRSRRSDQQDALDAVREDRVSIEGHLAGLEAASARIEAELGEVARQQALGLGGFGSVGYASLGDMGGISSAGWARPTAGAPTSAFGPRWGRSHNGVDLAGAVGSAVLAAQAGVVVQATTSCHPTSSWGCGSGFGNHVTIAHPGGLATIYAHLSSLTVGVGDAVAPGAPIGRVGNSGNSYGPHLHFEGRRSGAPGDPCGYIDC